MKTFIIILLFGQIALGAILEKNAEGDYRLTRANFKLSEVLADYGKIEGLNLIIGQDFMELPFTANGPLTIKKENFPNYLSVLLNESGYTMVRTTGTSIVNIINARDVRYGSLQSYTEIKEVPKDYNYHQFIYRLKHVPAAELARNMRPFMGRYGRVVDIAYSNGLVISDTGNNIHRLANIAFKVDKPEFVKNTKEVEEINARHEKVVKKEKAWTEILSNNTLIFILIFLLMGLVIGFGTRGYMMKKIEGGW